MDIMRPRAWRTCGWAATVLFGGIVTITVKIVHDGRGLGDGLAPILNVMIGACALLTGVRMLVPPIAKTRQQVELNLGLQRRILGTSEDQAAGPPNLRVVGGSEFSESGNSPHSSAG